MNAIWRRAGTAALLIAWLMSLLVLSGCGSVFHSRGLTLSASSNYAQLVKEYEPADRNYSRMPFSELIYLCSAYAGLKNYQSLFPCLETAQAKVNAGDCRADLWDHSALPLRVKAAAHIELGQYSEAVKAAEGSYEIVKKKGLERYDQVLTLEIIGVAYGLAGMDRSAENAAANIRRIMYAGSTGMLDDHINMALARIYMTLKRYQDALNVLSYRFEDSNTLAKAITGWDVFMGYKVQFEFMKNKSFLELGRAAEARQGYDALLEYPYIANQGEIYWNILFDRGRIAEMEDKPGEAVGFYTRAVDVIEQQRATINSEASKIGFVGDKQALYYSLVRALAAAGKFEKAFEYVERSKARALVDLLASKKDFAVKSGNEREIRELLAAEDAADRDLSSQDPSLDKSRTRSVSVRMREGLHARSPELASLVSVASPSLNDIQRLISTDEALVEYYYHDTGLYAFVLAGGELQAFRLSGDGLANDVQLARKALEKPGDYSFLEPCQRLYGRLFGPIAAAVNKPRLIVVPHGALHYFPFNVLHDGKGFLIERFSVRVLPSAGTMKFLAGAKPGKYGDILVFGNPDLGNPQMDLVFAQREAVAVAATLQHSRMFLRKEATEANFRQYAGGFRYIHFATHGMFDAEAPLKSALLLAPDAGSNGMLTADKLYSMQLDADLVTLSACETGLGAIANGDDVVGLTRGFLYAGSSSIVASLWKVDDQATSDLMSRFYRELEKTDKREALRRAQLAIKNKYSHPFYWASFQLMGRAQ